MVLSNTKLCHNRFYEATFPEFIHSIKTTKSSLLGLKVRKSLKPDVNGTKVGFCLKNFVKRKLYKPKQKACDILSLIVHTYTYQSEYRV